MQFFRTKLQKDHRELVEIIAAYRDMMRSDRPDLRQLQRNLQGHLRRLSDLETEMDGLRDTLGVRGTEIEFFENDVLLIA